MYANTIVSPPSAKIMTLEVVTPEMAKLWLDRSIGNRPLSQQTVTQYAEEMAFGGWRDTASSPILFSDEGQLMNGHHRLHAVVRCGYPVEMYVVRGEDKGNMVIVDRGRARTRADNLYIVTKDAGCKVREAALRVMLNFFTRSKTKPSDTSLNAAEDGMRDEFSALFEIAHIRKRVAAPYLAALAFYYPIAPEATFATARRLAARDAEMGTGAAGILRLMANREYTSGSTGRVDAFSRTVNGLEKIVRNEKVEFLRPNDALVKSVNNARASLGRFSFSGS